MRKWAFLLGVLILLGCGRGEDPVILYNEGVQRWDAGKKGEALWYVKKAYLLDPGNKTIFHTYEKMRFEFADKPPMEKIILGVKGVNAIGWFSLLFFLVAGILVVIYYGEFFLSWLDRIKSWSYGRHIIILLYLIGVGLLVIQVIGGVRLFFPKPAVIVYSTDLLDRPEEEGLVVGKVLEGTEGWVIKKSGSYGLFRSENGKEGWVVTNTCWGVW